MRPPATFTCRTSAARRPLAPAHSSRPEPDEAGRLMPVPRLSFIVPVRNDAVRLRTCLESIRASSARFPCEMLVVDNGSTDNSADVAKQAGARVIAMPGGRVSELRNAAAREAAADVLAFVDADHELAREW